MNSESHVGHAPLFTVILLHPNPIILVFSVNSSQQFRASTAKANWILMGYISHANIHKKISLDAHKNAGNSV